MPSPIRKRGARRIYKRKTGKGRLSGKRGYSLHVPSLDRRTAAKKGTAQQVERYPHAYDMPKNFILVKTHMRDLRRGGRMKVKAHRRRF